MALSRAKPDADCAAYRYTNVRFNVRLLELLEPGASLGDAFAEPQPRD